MEINRFGIEDVSKITSYSIKTNKEQDELTIKLKDKKFGIFNRHKKAVFKRNQRALTLNNEIVMFNEISPLLLKILDNLDSSKIKLKRNIF
jgi:hypothetical protein